MPLWPLLFTPTDILNIFFPSGFVFSLLFLFCVSLNYLECLQLAPSFSVFITPDLALFLCLFLSASCTLLRVACLLFVRIKQALSLSLSPSLLPASVEEKEALKKNKSNCLPVSNSPRHPLQPSCLYPHPGGRRERRRDGGGCGSSSRGECVYVCVEGSARGWGASWLEADSDSLCFLSDQPWINLRLRPHLGMNLQHRSVHTYTHKHTQTFPHYNVCICLQISTEMHPSAKRAFRLTVVLSDNLHFKYANKSDIYHRNMDVNIP